MKLPENIKERFRRYGRQGGQERASRLSAVARRRIAARGASARWIRQRFGSDRFESLGLPGGDLVDRGLSDLAADRVSVESLLVSLAAPRLRREGIPVGATLPEPERKLQELLAREDGDSAHFRYNAYRRRIVSFADSCRFARRDRE
ncbi:MAG TPA: hypothetical protein VFV19_07350 [Candidatus Polarisedimenticolaceae bacterium]|nr:hypothetical protein [Candidatus Polarisedimenticolaceae bacterium]